MDHSRTWSAHSSLGLLLGQCQPAMSRVLARRTVVQDRVKEPGSCPRAARAHAASISYLTGKNPIRVSGNSVDKDKDGALVGVLSLAAALQLGWRVTLLASLVVPIVAWWCSRRVSIEAPPPSHAVTGRLPVVFWIAAAMLFCTTAAEWCVTAWGATFVQDAAGVSSATAVAVMAGYFGGVLVGRTLGSRLARQYGPARLLAIALGVTAAGFAVLWPSTAPAPALAGLSLLGIGLGNLFPMGVSLAVALAPGQSALASGRVVAMSSFAVVLAPLTVGTLADETSLKMALGVVPVMVVLAAAGLTLVARTQARISDPTERPGAASRS
jgi:predicted MFS family arabinose efflux permease